MSVYINGRIRDITKANNMGQISLYVTTSGGGDGSSWSSACTFREAIAKCTGTCTYRIFLGAGIHDTDNGADANGTTISAENVIITGMGVNTDIGQISTLANKANSVSYILRITGACFAIEKVVFDNGDQTDPNGLIQLDIRANGSTIHNCLFAQSFGNTDVTGILLNNNSARHSVSKNSFIGINIGINYGDVSGVQLENNTFIACTTGLLASHAEATNGICVANQYMGCTTALNVTTAQTNTWYLENEQFFNNTTNISALTDYAGSIYIQNLTKAIGRTALYPPAETLGTGGTGITCSTGDGAWVWTASATTVIPADTIAQPFLLTGIYFQDWNASQTYRIELFYGDATANISLGIKEVTLGDPAAKYMTNMHIEMNTYIPANAIIGAKVCSNTDGIDSVTISLEYDPL